MTELGPIFVDKTARPKDYDYLKEDELLISSIFSTIQGEGPFTGYRCVFVRLAGCNLGGKGVTGPGCDFCDTDFRLSRGKCMSFEDIYGEIGKIHPGVAGADYSRLIIITGGEPMLQKNLPGFITSAPRHTKPGAQTFRFQIESNGTRLLDIPKTRVALVVSPKVPIVLGSNKTFKYAKLSDRVMQRADYLKYIISADPSSPYYNVPDDAKAFTNLGKRVYINPMTIYLKAPENADGDTPASAWDTTLVDHLATAENHGRVADLAMRHGYIAGMQQHLFYNVA